MFFKQQFSVFKQHYMYFLYFQKIQKILLEQHYQTDLKLQQIVT